MTGPEFEAWLREMGQYEAYVERQRQTDAEVARLRAELRQAERPVVEDLRAIGISVESVWDLVNVPSDYPKAVPVLREHLRKPYPPAVRDGIARALAVPTTRENGWDVLVDEYMKETVERVRQGLAAAIAACATEDDLDQVLSLARDPANGESRGLFLLAFGRIGSPKARAAVMELGGDPDLAYDAQRILRKLNRRKKR